MYILVHTGMYWYVLICTNTNYLRSDHDQLSNHEGKREHEHFHAVASHLGLFLAINKNLVEVGSVLGGHGDWWTW